MKNKNIYLYGAGGHAKVVMDILDACRMQTAGIVDDAPTLEEFMGYEVAHEFTKEAEYIISIGNCNIRKKVAEKLSNGGCSFATAIHPSATVSPHAGIEEGSVVMQGAVIQSCAHIGRHCIVNTNASVDHDCKIEDFVHIAPGATLCGEVCVGAGSWIGAGAVVIQGVKIGKGCMIGAGAVVCSDIPDGVVAYGNPCKVKRRND